tara:strand:+ start:429 stop:551 length:123 start_codon:yes stop_codon:yes gene_type:complete
MPEHPEMIIKKDDNVKAAYGFMIYPQISVTSKNRRKIADL